MPAVTAPPAATPPASTPAPAAPPASSGSAFPPSGGEIHVTPPAAGSEGNPNIDPPKPGSARDRMHQDLRKKAGLSTPAAPPKPKGAETPPAPAARPAATPPATPPAEAPAEPPAGEAAPGTPAPGTPEDKKKANPWKLLDEHKARNSSLEREILELKKKIIPDDQVKDREERLKKAEARAKEMEDDLRYFNAEKYDPDILKANADYEGAWKRALSELGELSVIDAVSEAPRPLKAEDILALVNMPLGQAREAANAAFGDFANDVMNHRKEIKRLFEDKMAKLEELKKNGAARDKARGEARQKSTSELSGQIKQFWGAEEAEALANERHGKNFKPREGDADWNTRLENGFKLVDEAYAKNVMDPGLTPQERQGIVKRHIAVRNRAAAYAPLMLELGRVTAKLADVEKKLAAYEQSTPGNTPGAPAAAPASSGKAWDQLRENLAKIAKPG